MQNIPEVSAQVSTTETTTEKTQALLSALRARFAVLAEFKPLKIKIHLEIREALAGQDIPNIRIAHALAWHVNNGQYLKALAKGGARYNLAGEIDGEVTEEQRKHAAEQLKERWKKKKKPKAPPQSQTSPIPATPTTTASPVVAESPEKPQKAAPSHPVEAPPPARPVLKLKPKAGTVTAATVARKEPK